MKARVLGCLALTAGAIWTASPAEANGFLQPGQFMGLAVGAPLPEGVFASDLQSVTKYDNTGSTLGVNIPIISYSTPISFYDTRLIVSYSLPWIQQAGQPTLSNTGGGSRVDAVSQALGLTLAHSFGGLFGGGFSASLSAFGRSPDNILHTTTGTDIFAGLSYTRNGFDINATFTYSGTLGSTRGTPNVLQGIAQETGVRGENDTVGVDFSAVKHFGKAEFGLVGYAFTDTNVRATNAGFNVVGFNANGVVLQPYSKKLGEFALGGLVGYDFGRVTVQGMVTRDIAKRFAYNGVQGLAGNFGAGGYSTIGWVRLIVPLYVAPAPQRPILARY